MEKLFCTNFETLTVAAVVKTLTASKYSPTSGMPADHAYLTVEGGNIRFRTDGTDPTTSVGHLLESGDVLELSIAEIVLFKAIREGSVSGTLQISYLTKK